VPFNELRDKRLVGRMCFFRCATRPRLRACMRWDFVCNETPSRIGSPASRSGLNKIDDGFEHIVRRFQKSAMNANLGGGKAHDHGPVLRETNAIVTVETKTSQSFAELVRSLRT
jgi:hypothetical protein